MNTILLICLILSILLNLGLCCAFYGTLLLKRAWSAAAKKSEEARAIQTRATLAAWEESMKKWGRSHTSIPSALLPLALHMDTLSKPS